MNYTYSDDPISIFQKQLTANRFISRDCAERLSRRPSKSSEYDHSDMGWREPGKLIVSGVLWKQARRSP